MHDTEMLCAADYPAQQVQWLWPGRIPIGKVTLLAGDPGQGKSLVALDIAARVTRGAAWPDEDHRALTPVTHVSGSPVGPACRARPEPGEDDASPCPDEPPCRSQHVLVGNRHKSRSVPFRQNGPTSAPGSVLILSAEDDLRDTIRPRLDAAGADPSRVFLLPSIEDLRHDLPKLRAALDHVPDCRLVIIDPVTAFVGPGDSHFHSIVRKVLQPLAQLAAEKGLAVLAISHLRKSEGAAIQRAAGSMGFVATARAVWTVCDDPQQAGRHLLLPLKNNLVASTSGLAYTINSPMFTDESPAITWQEQEVTTSADEALDKKQRGPAAVELKAATEWLQDQLAAGPQSAWLITAEGVVAGFSDRTLRRALYALGGKTIKRSWQEGWCWSLPSTAGESPSPVPRPLSPPNILSPSKESCPLGENKHILEQETRPLRPSVGPSLPRRTSTANGRSPDPNQQTTGPPLRQTTPAADGSLQGDARQAGLTDGLHVDIAEQPAQEGTAVAKGSALLAQCIRDTLTLRVQHLAVQKRRRSPVGRLRTGVAKHQTRCRDP